MDPFPVTYLVRELVAETLRDGPEPRRAVTPKVTILDV
jgi:hypothetical protein